MSFPLYILLLMLFIHVRKPSNSRSQMFFKTGVLKNFAQENIHSKVPVMESFINKVAGLNVCIFIKKGLQHRCFTMNIEYWLLLFIKFFRNFMWWYILNILRLYFAAIKWAHNRKNVTIGQSKCLVKRCFFSRPRFQLSFKEFYFWYISFRFYRDL